MKIDPVINKTKVLASEIENIINQELLIDINVCTCKFEDQLSISKVKLSLQGMTIT